MGFIDTAPGTQLPVFYNVVHAVGKQCPNIPDDVKLVQYLLKILYDKFPTQKRPSGYMKVDGICGPITRHWIIRFQMDFAADNPGVILVDGRVDRVRNKTSFYGSISHTQYTLAVLNRNAAKLDPAGWSQTSSVVPLSNPMFVPPPSVDIIPETKSEDWWYDASGSGEVFKTPPVEGGKTSHQKWEQEGYDPASGQRIPFEEWIKANPGSYKKLLI